MPVTTRQRLVQAAVRRFYRDGFRNVGIDQILTDVGISKTAFYKHFESKEDLMLAALQMQHEWLQQTLLTMIQERGGPTPLGRLQAVMDVVDHIIATDDFQGCIFVNAAMEFPLQHEPAHVAASNSKRAIEDILCDLAEQAGVADPRGMAQQLCLVMEGTYVTRHVTGNKRTIDIARRVANLVIAEHCSGCANTDSNPTLEQCEDPASMQDRSIAN
jgi:AcrR family transcriptional regulator